MSKRISAILLLAFLLCIASVSAQAVTNVAYENGKRIVLKYAGKQVTFPGQAPEFSPDGSKLAFLRHGNVYVLDLNTNTTSQITRLAASDLTFNDFRLRVRWHPSGQFIAFTRVGVYRYLPKKHIFVPASKIDEKDNLTVPLMTIWLMNLRTGETWRDVNLMGNFNFFHKSNQLEAASVYEPFFSPDGRNLGFANAGSLFQVPLVDHPTGVRTVTRLIALTGELDPSPHPSKSGQGVREIAWDAEHHRIVYWIGRFWGMSWNEYGYVPWKNGKWGKATEWDPGFAPADPSGNNRKCAFDSKGRLWIWAEDKSMTKVQWMRYDAREKLPFEADNPTFR